MLVVGKLAKRLRELPREMAVGTRNKYYCTKLERNDDGQRTKNSNQKTRNTHLCAALGRGPYAVLLEVAAGERSVRLRAFRGMGRPNLT